MQQQKQLKLSNKSSKSDPAEDAKLNRDDDERTAMKKQNVSDADVLGTLKESVLFFVCPLSFFNFHCSFFTFHF